MLAGALDGRAVGAEQVRTIVATMGTLPTAMPVLDREWWEKFLVDQAGELDPRQLDQVAAAVLDAPDPDRTLDKTQTRTRMELSWRSRNARTGLTGLVRARRGIG